MANYRTLALLDAETATTAATKIVDLNLTEVISRITIEYAATNNSSTPTAHPAAIVSKIELVDGSDVLVSLNGYEAQALDLLTTDDTNYLNIDYVNGNTVKPVFTLNFGRFLYDPVLALDPKRFRNLQLKITHSCSSGGSSPNAGTLSVFVDLFDDKKVTPIGFLQSKEIFTYNPTANAAKYIDLPTDLTIRAIMLKGRYANLHPWDNIYKVKLYEDEGRKVIIDNIKTSDIIKYFPNNQVFYETIRLTNSATAFTAYCMPTEDVNIQWAPIAGSASNWLGLASYGGTFTAQGSAATNGDCLVTGRCPHGGFLLPLGDMSDYTDWFNPNGVKSLKLMLTAGSNASSSANNEVIVQQLRKY